MAHGCYRWLSTRAIIDIDLRSMATPNWIRAPAASHAIAPANGCR